jgi:hypothetical protein
MIADVALVMVLEGRGFRWLEVFVSCSSSSSSPGEHV